jgi:hypothetical protein
MALKEVWEEGVAVGFYEKSWGKMMHERKQKR